MDIRVINLDRSPDRRTAMEEQLRIAGLTARFARGIDGGTDDILAFREHFEPPANSYFFRPLMPGEIGCFASHYLLWEECAAGGPMLVLEDDCLFHPGASDVVARLPELLRSHPLLRLQGSVPRASRPVRPLPGGGTVARLEKGPRGTMAYALAPDAARRLIRHAEKWLEPVDNYIDHFWLHGVLPFAILPYCAGSMRVPSLIGGGSRKEKKSAIRRLSRKLHGHAETMRRFAFKLGSDWRAAGRPKAPA